MIWITDGGESPYYAGLILVLVGLAILMRWTVRMSLRMSAFLLTCYLIAILPSAREVPLAVIVANFFFLISAVVIVVIGTYLYEVTRRSEFQLRREVEDQNAELEKNELQLLELDEAKTRFFANVSHELRTPLTIMLGTTETLMKPEVKDRSERLGILQSNGLRLLALIDNLLDLVRFDQGDDQVNLEPVAPEEFIGGLLSGISHLAATKNVEMRLVFEEQIPVLLLDKDKLEKVVLNLLMNAVKFTNFGGSIVFTAKWKRGDLSFSVEDDGIGMTEEKSSQVFGRFWQADTSSNRKFRGSGIGLSLTKNLVELMQGEISVVSEEGKGSTFFVTLPAKESKLSKSLITTTATEDPVAEMHRKAMTSLPQAMVTEPEEPSQIMEEEEEHEFTVLVVDDESDLLRFLSLELAQEHRVLEAGDGLKALALIDQYEPDLVLLDYMMPDKNGMEVCREVRASRRHQNLPIIMLTARADDEIKLECLRHGASDFLSKPFSLAELHLRVKNQLTLVSSRRKLQRQNVELAEAMDELKENEVKMLRQEKLSSLGRMSAGIIHEINNPLNYVQGAHFMLGRHGSALTGETAAEFKDALKDAREGVERVGQIITDLRSLTTTGEQPLTEVNLHEVVDSAHKFNSNQLGEGITVEVDIDPAITVSGHKGQLIQVFVNFFQNSIHAIQSRQKEEPELKGEIRAGATRLPGKNTKNVVLCTFRDNGCGIPAEARAKIFDPFYTSKEVGEGMGLGLSIVHQIFERHQVEFALDTEEGQFSEFQLSFPSIVPSN